MVLEKDKARKNVGIKSLSYSSATQILPTTEYFQLLSNDEYQTVMQQHQQMMIEAETKLIKTVLETLLKREVVLKDAEGVTRVFMQGFPDVYQLCYQGVLLGTVKRDTCGFSFTPDEKYDGKVKG